MDLKRLRGFFGREDGAATVDWVVLTGAIALLGLSAAFYLSSSVPQLADDVSTYMSDYDVGGWRY